MCRQFEDTQGRLEAAVEQCSLPLALMPHIQVPYLCYRGLCDPCGLPQSRFPSSHYKHPTCKS